jgi:hypothetical protein
MPVTIKEITSEVVLAPEREQTAQDADLRPQAREELLEALVRQATERVIARLRLEWER